MPVRVSRAQNDLAGPLLKPLQLLLLSEDQGGGPRLGGIPEFGDDGCNINLLQLV